MLLVILEVIALQHLVPLFFSLLNDINEILSCYESVIFKCLETFGNYGALGKEAGISFWKRRKKMER